MHFLSYYISIKILEKASLDVFEEPQKLQNLELFSKFNLTNINRYEKNIFNDVINPKNISVNLNDIICDQLIRSNILFVLDSLKNKVPRNIPLLDIPNGVILYGPPGTGKTMLAKSIAKECNMPFINVSYSSIENKFFGESPKILKAYFTLADKLKPCILFFDEIDGFLSKRNALDQSPVNGLKTLFLTLMDGLISRDSTVLAIGATNRIDQLDPAVKRRMSNHIYMDLPDIQQIQKYIHFLLPNEHFDNCLFKSLSGMSYSNIKELLKYCAKQRYLNNKHLEKWNVNEITDYQHLFHFTNSC